VPHELLSARESQVLILLASERASRRLARDLHLSPKTASTYKTRVMQKLKVASDAELVRYASRTSWSGSSPGAGRARP